MGIVTVEDPSMPALDEIVKIFDELSIFLMLYTIPDTVEGVGSVQTKLPAVQLNKAAASELDSVVFDV